MNKKLFYFNILSILLLFSFIGIYLYRTLHYIKIDKSRKKMTTILSDRILEEEDSFYLVTEIEKINNTYYFMKTTRNNYVYYKGMSWRIIKVNEDKTTTLILNDYVTAMPYNTVDKWLNITMEKDTGVYSKLLNIDNIELLSIDDYNNTGGTKSFINNKTDFWISNNKYIDSEGNIKDNDNNYHKVRPVITLPSDTKIYAGTGGVDKPFVIEKDNNITTLKEIDTNKYIKYNNMLWKVIEIQDNKIKLLCEENIKDSDNLIISRYFSYYNNNIDSKRNILYYLNNTYYNTIENNNYLIEGPFYIGKYKDNDFTNIYTESINLKIGLPTIADPYIYTGINTFLITSNYNNNKNIYSINNNKLYETLITEESNIRPVIYMKKNISITTGNGSIDNPYILGGIINEKK